MLPFFIVFNDRKEIIAHIEKYIFGEEKKIDQITKKRNLPYFGH